ncbi:MAG: DUF454 domain-containing protein [Aeromonadales bacterium]|nr:DUF454 domain-containing protein [Aeromonadales bacterium]
MRILFALLGVISLVLGVIGAFLPLLPTTPFILLSAYLFSKSSPRMHHWMINHPWFGALIQDWQTHRGMRASVKKKAIIMMTLSFAFSIYIVPLWWVKVGLGVMYIVLVIGCWRLPVVPEPPMPAKR